jgi:hypothetical protein
MKIAQEIAAIMRHHAQQGPNGRVENRIQPGGLPATAHEACSLIGSFSTEKRPGCQD